MAVRSIEVLIGATLTGGFRSSFGQARTAAAQLGSTLRGLDSQSRMVDGLRRQEAATGAAKSEWEQAEDRVRALTAAQRGARAPTQAEANALARAEAAAKRTKVAYDALAGAINSPRQISVTDANRLGRTQAAAQRATDAVEAYRRAMGAPVTPSASSLAALERTRAAAERARGAVASIGATLAAGPSQAEQERLATLRAKKQAADQEVATRRAALGRGEPGSDRRIAQLAQVRQQAAEADEQVKSLERSITRGMDRSRAIDIGRNVKAASSGDIAAAAAFLESEPLKQKDSVGRGARNNIVAERQTRAAAGDQGVSNPATAQAQNAALDTARRRASSLALQEQALAERIASTAGPTEKQATALKRAQDRAASYESQIRSLSSATSAGRAPTAAQAKALEAAQARVARYTTQAESMSAAMTRGTAPTAGQTEALRKLESRAAEAQGRVATLQQRMSSASAATPAQSARLTRLAAAHQAAASKADTLKNAIASATGPTRQQAAELSRATTMAERAKTAYTNQVAALQRMDAAAASSGINTRNLAGEQARLGRTLDEARRKTDALAAAEARRERRADTGRSLFMEGGATIAAGIPMVQSITIAGDFEHGLARFGTIARESGDTAAAMEVKLASLRTQLVAFARETNQSAPDLLGGMAALIGRGMSGSDALKAIKDIGTAATATGASVEELSDTTFALTTQMGIRPEAIMRTFNILGQSAKDGGFELRDMAKYFPLLGAQAQQLGITGERGVAQIGAMLQVARQGAAAPADAANNLRNFMQKLTSEETIKNFKEFGIDLEAEMKDAMARGISPVERALSIIQDITGGDQFKISKLFQDMQVNEFVRPMLSSKGQADYRRMRDEAFRARQPAGGERGVIDQDFAVMMATFKEAAKGAGIAIWALGESIGKALIPVVTPLVQGFTVAATGLTRFTTAFPGVTGAILGATFGLMGLRLAMLGVRFATLLMGFAGIKAALIGTAVMAGRLGMAMIGLARGAFMVFAVGTSMVSGAVMVMGRVLIGAVALMSRALIVGVAATFRTVSAVMLATPFGWVVAAIGAVGLAAYSIYQNWEPISAWFNGVWTGMGTIVSSVGNSIKAVWGSVFDYIASKFDFLFNGIERLRAIGARLGIPGFAAAALPPVPAAVSPTIAPTPATGAAPSVAPGTTVPSPTPVVPAPVPPPPIPAVTRPMEARPGSWGAAPRTGAAAAAAPVPGGAIVPVPGATQEAANIPFVPGGNNVPRARPDPPLLVQRDPALGGTALPSSPQGRPGEMPRVTPPDAPMVVDDRRPAVGNAATPNFSAPTPASTAVAPPPSTLTTRQIIPRNDPDDQAHVRRATALRVRLEMAERRRQQMEGPGNASTDAGIISQQIRTGQTNITTTGSVVMGGTQPAAPAPGPAPGGIPLAGAREAGGPISAGKPYLVGERGPEIVIPRQDGTVIPNHEISEYRTAIGDQFEPRLPGQQLAGKREDGGPVQAGRAYLMGERGREIVHPGQQFRGQNLVRQIAEPVIQRGMSAFGGATGVSPQWLMRAARDPATAAAGFDPRGVQMAGANGGNAVARAFGGQGGMGGRGLPGAYGQGGAGGDGYGGMATSVGGQGGSSAMNRMLANRGGPGDSELRSTSFATNPYRQRTGRAAGGQGGYGQGPAGTPGAPGWPGNQPNAFTGGAGVSGGGPAARRVPVGRAASAALPAGRTGRTDAGTRVPSVSIPRTPGDDVVGPAGLTPAQEAIAPAGSSARRMMDLIGKAEGTDRRGADGQVVPGSGYSTTYAHGRYNPGGNRNEDLTTKSIAEVREFQRGMLNNQQGNGLRSSAAGRYQMMGYTLDDAMKQGIVRPDEKFDAATQDRLAAWKMNQRGARQVEAGTMSREQHANNLAMEWASLPNASGQGHYAGQRSHVDRGQVMTALNAPSATQVRANTPPPPAPPPAVGATQISLPGTPPVPAAPPAVVGPPGPAGSPGAAAPIAGGGALIGATMPTPAPASTADAAAPSPAVGQTQADANGGGGAASPAQDPAQVGSTQIVPASAPAQPTSLTSEGNVAPQAMGSSGGTSVGSISMPISVTVQAGGGEGGKGADPNEIARIARLEVSREAQRQMASLRARLHD